jgi:RNA polymerase sigma factor (sigma-70 family)
MSSTQSASVPARWARAAELFVAWRAGETGALDDLVRLLTPVLWQVARAHGLDREGAEDVVQSTWMTLVRKADDIADAAAVSSWLMTTTRRAAWRAATRDRHSVSVEDDELERRSPARPGVDDDVVAADEAHLLWRSVHRLDPRCQRLLRVIAFDDRPDYAAISADLGMPVGSIGPTRGRCLAKLRGLLAEAAADERAGGAARGTDEGGRR